MHDPPNCWYETRGKHPEELPENPVRKVPWNDLLYPKSRKARLTEVPQGYSFSYDTSFIRSPEALRRNRLRDGFRGGEYYLGRSSF
jgi:hypothetical protein